MFDWPLVEWYSSVLTLTTRSVKSLGEINPPNALCVIVRTTDISCEWKNIQNYHHPIAADSCRVLILRGLSDRVIERGKRRLRCHRHNRTVIMCEGYHSEPATYRSDWTCCNFDLMNINGDFDHASVSSSAGSVHASRSMCNCRI